MNHTGEAIQTFARIGLIIGLWPPYNTTIPYVYCTFIWHPYFPYIKLKEVILGFPILKWPDHMASRFGNSAKYPHIVSSSLNLHGM